MAVYVTQLVYRKDKITGAWKPAHNLEPAKQFGEIKILYRPEPGIRTDKNPDQLLDALEEGLKDFTEDDYLILVGAPEATCAAAAYAARATDGYIALLTWNSFNEAYELSELNLWNADER